MFMNPKGAYPEFDKRLAEALRSAGFQEGVVGYEEEYGVLTDGRHLDNYLLTGLIAELIENGHVELKINPSISPERYDYLLRLLKLKKRGE